jgi:hypothetical protein
MVAVLGDVGLLVEPVAYSDEWADRVVRAGCEAWQVSGIRPVLCEINASSVILFPPEAPQHVAAHVLDAIRRHRAPG